jgi:hypothetical protein
VICGGRKLYKPCDLTADNADTVGSADISWKVLSRSSLAYTGLAGSHGLFPASNLLGIRLVLVCVSRRR